MITELGIEKADEWDTLVMSFKAYDIYYLSSYVKAFMLHKDGEPKLIFYKNANTRAINVIMLRDIGCDLVFSSKLPKGVYWDIITPYGYGGFLIEGNTSEEAIESLDKEYSSYCTDKGIISETVRFHPILNNSYTLSKMYRMKKLGQTISINLNSRNEIWENLNSKNRNMLRKAIREEVHIDLGLNQELMDQFIKLYYVTMKRDKAKEYYYFKPVFFQSILQDCRNNAFIFYARYKESMAAMSIILFSNHNMHYHLSASDSEYRHLAPTNLLLYEAACWGYRNGFKYFHLGGGVGGNEDNLYRFKKSFNRNHQHDFYLGAKVFDQKKYNALVEIRELIEKKEGTEDCQETAKNDFFPEYRK